MSKVIPFPKLRLTTESRWPYEPLVKPRSEDMRVVVVEAERLITYVIGDRSRPSSRPCRSPNPSILLAFRRCGRRPGALSPPLSKLWTSP